MESPIKPYWKGERLRRANLDKGKALCQVSGRWLQFPEKAHEFADGTYLPIDVMTSDDEGRVRKLCELVLVKEDLLDLLARIPNKK